MIKNISLKQFLQLHLGHEWTPVSFDDTEYGFHGESIFIEPSSDIHSANGFQSQLMTDVVATQAYNQLVSFGLAAPEDFQRVETDDGITLLFTIKGAEHVMVNEALLGATEEQPLIGETGKEAFLAAHHPSKLQSPRQKALEFLDEAIHKAAPNTLWNTECGDYALHKLDPELAEDIRLALKDKGVSCAVRPRMTHSGTFADITVRAVTMDRVLGTFNDNRGRVDAASEAASYLKDAVYDIVPDGVWHRPVEEFGLNGGGTFVLQNVEHSKLELIQGVLNARGIVSQIVDGEEPGAHDLEVKSHALAYAMDRAAREASYSHSARL